MKEFSVSVKEKFRQIDFVVLVCVLGMTALSIITLAGSANELVGTLKKGAKVEIFEKKDVNGTYWGRINQGWICMKFVKTESGEPAETVIAKGTVNTDDVKIRSTPDTGAIVGTYKTGDKVSFFEKKTAGSAEWGRTDKGWVCLLYVTME